MKYDVEGVSDELMKDESFRYELKILSSEIDISQYLNPRNAVILKVVKAFYLQNKKNKIKKDFNNILNNKEKLEEIKNLAKNINKK